MKLKLKNFRCYLDNEFDFGDEGLLLLSGGSGSGKSSLLMAITFVLYGTGTKLNTFGKTSCSVEMVFNELRIIRTKKPNRLVITNLNTNEQFEDDSAQSIINERFGNAFEITSYLQQNAVNSFILMSPLEKLEFLEKFAFQGVDLTAIKGRCNSIIKKRNEELIASTSQLEMASQHFNTLNQPKKVPFPFKTKDKELKIKNETIRQKNTRTLLKRNTLSLESLKQEYNELKLYLVKIEGKNEVIATATRKKDNIEVDMDKIIYEGDSVLIEYEKQLMTILSQKELVLLQERYKEDIERMETMKQEEMQEIEKEISNIENQLWKEYSPTEISTTISEYQQLVKDAEALERLEKNIEKYKNYKDDSKLQKDIEMLKKSKEELSKKKEILSRLLLQQQLYECPSCHVSVKIQGSELHLANKEIEPEENIDDIHEDIEKLEQKISQLEYTIPEEQNKHKRYLEITKEIETIKAQYEEEIPSKNEVENNIEYLKEYKRSQQELEKRKKKLQSGENFSSSLQLFMKQLSTKKEQIKELENKLKSTRNIDDTCEEELRGIIQTQKRNKEKKESYTKEIKVLSREINSATQDVKQLEEEYLQKYNNIKELSNMEEEIIKTEKEISVLQRKLEEHDANMKKIEEYQKYKEEIDRYNEWKNKVKDLTVKEQKNRQEYSASTLLKDKILEAESLSILNIISSINIHAQEYLDLFFPDHPIVVRLLPFKTTKKNTTKPQINIEIDYRGMEADINMLSGGELSRVVLAYTLALSEIFNAPMVMLDECTSSLDAELTSTVMEGIKKNFEDKLVIIIAHQVVEGDFDRKITL